MIAKVSSCGLMGIDGFMVEVECDVSIGMPAFDIVGLPDTAVKESKERCKSAIQSMGFDFPLGRVTINLAPSHLKKEGSGFDLPIAVAILLSGRRIMGGRADDLDSYVFLGELALSGILRPVRGVLPMAIAAYQAGFTKIIVPKANAEEAAIVKDLQVYGARDMSEVLLHICGEKPMQPTTVDIDAMFEKRLNFGEDFADVKGQRNVKRGLEIAAAGGHNCLMIGTPGSGKTMLAKRISAILPDLSFDEALEITKIHSTAGNLRNECALMTMRPFRSPHHTVSTVSLAGGGRVPRPGEVSLAHGGVLFLDEFPEFRKDALEILRQPLEDSTITITRVNSTVAYPCNFMLVAAMNPCKCGYYGDTKRVCTCTQPQIQRYLGKLSGPLLDRIDLHIDVSPVEYDNLTSSEQEETSKTIRGRVNAARQLQRERYKDHGIYCNADLTSPMLEKFCRLGDAEAQLLKTSFENLGLSARAYSRIIKVARTIADLAGERDISVYHLSEAIGFRSLDRKYFA